MHTYTCTLYRCVYFVSLQINPLQAQLDMEGSSLAPKTLVSVSADQPLQLTLTRSSVGEILNLVDVSLSHTSSLMGLCGAYLFHLSLSLKAVSGHVKGLVTKALENSGPFGFIVSMDPLSSSFLHLGTFVYMATLLYPLSLLACLRMHSALVVTSLFPSLAIFVAGIHQSC